MAFFGNRALKTYKRSRCRFWKKAIACGKRKLSDTLLVLQLSILGKSDRLWEKKTC
ncbi:MAG: hypothetical protein AB4368_05715 [Xenococcaceae cyanobacterium]